MARSGRLVLRGGDDGRYHWTKAANRIRTRATPSTGRYFRNASLRALYLFSCTIGLRVGRLAMGARVVGRMARLGAADGGAECVGTSEGDSEG
jgi:hypothetical protein